MQEDPTWTRTKWVLTRLLTGFLFGLGATLGYHVALLAVLSLKELVS